MTLALPAGLCATCRHGRQVRSRRGSSFLLCGLARTDARFPRYPRLPVLACAGYAPQHTQQTDPENQEESEDE